MPQEPAQIRDVLPAMKNSFTSEALNGIWCTRRCPAHDAQINADERGATVRDGRRVIVNAPGQSHIPITVSRKLLGVTVDRLYAVAPFGRDTQRQQTSSPRIPVEQRRNQRPAFSATV